MGKIIARLLGLAMVMILLAGLLTPATPASAGDVTWSAETIPSTRDFTLGPAGIDVRDFAVATDDLTIYAVPGDSVSDNVVYKSTNAGVSWTDLRVDIQADLVAVAPGNADIVAITNISTPVVYLTINGGSTWVTIGTPQESGAAAAVAIYDLAISRATDGKYHIAAAGKEAGNVANVWYYEYGATIPVWTETNTLPGFSSADEVAAIAFSPNFHLDRVLLAVSADYGASVKLQMLSLDAEVWNESAGFYDFPVTVVSNSGITGLASASISLDPSYTAEDYGLRIVFIGLAVSGNAAAVATSGIYKLIDTIQQELMTETQIHSIAFDGMYLVAGDYNNNNVYYISNPLAATPIVGTVTTTKRPGGQNKVLVAWAGNKVFAGTSGNESGFAISTNNGYTFSDISLIDTIITNARDVAVSADGSIIYLSTDDGTDLSLWRKDTVWRRVLSQHNTSNYIVRIAPDNADVIYLAKKNGTIIYYNAGAGTTTWQRRTCSVNIQDLAVESDRIAYVLDSTGLVSKTINTGTAWGTAMPTMLSSGATIVSVSADTLLVGSQDGYVAYSTDGNLSWTKIIQVLQNGAGRVQVVADEDFAANRIIYAASNTVGQNIKKWKIGTSTSWTDIYRGAIAGGIYGLVINDDTLYALEFNTTTGHSTLWLHLSPTTITDLSTSWSYSMTTASTDIDDTSVHLNATPQALKVSTAKLWAVKTNGTNKLYSFSEVPIEITKMKPASGFINRVNTITGLAHDIGFSWERPSEATEYELQIALDNQFNIPVTTIIIATDKSPAFVLVGPDQTGNARVNFMVGSTYYWRVRTTKPIYSAYTKTRSFSIEPLVALVPALITPANGSSDISRKPSFSWEAVAGTSEYQFMLGDNASMISPIVDIQVENTAFTMDQELDYGSTYFWKVRTLAPMESNWSILANFTVEEEPVEPVPPVVVQPVPPAIIEIPSSPPPDIITYSPSPVTPTPVVPDYLRVVIIIAAIFLLAVIALMIKYLGPRLFPARLAPSRPVPEPVRVNRGITSMLGRFWQGLAAYFQNLRLPGSSKELKARTRTAQEVDASQPISFAAKSFLWMLTSEKEESKRLLSVDEEQALGKKLASRIQAIASDQLLYQQLPEDAALFLHLWSHYGSRDETNRYLVDSFQSRPENVTELLKCYFTPPRGLETGTADNIDFIRNRYDALAEVVDPDEVYKALTRLYGRELDWTLDEASGDSPDKMIAYQFARIHRLVEG